MISTKTYPPSRFNSFAIQAYRLVLGRILPQSLWRDKIPKEADRKAVNGRFNLEIVSHCWGYANMLTYQLSSFVNYPPTKLQLTVTIFYAEEDLKTKATLDFFAQQSVPNVTWNFQVLSKGKLFRRSIGRNMAARSTTADWVWFTDCDIIFHENCLDSLADSLQHEKGLLFFPEEEKISEMLKDDDPLLIKDAEPQLIDINTENFSFYERNKSRNKARGPFQIAHGDVVRAIGYCEKISMFQTESESWSKCYEDTAFRWLLGTDGEPKKIDGVFHIQHVTKGRYAENSKLSAVRSNIRQSQK
ncbi:glycosyltransferase [uncultured Paraglaciecola sp.]|uniref:glycosyltransferase family 2 protein n=1 Tax=uncultured Paraglaciecola sp. TaxID=1765024 RepID=UPI00260FE51D|nr:glycosyltransferase [uncultured Paraglaciecola sp.]